MDNIKIEYLPIGDLTPYERNQRKHADYDVSQIMVSIQKDLSEDEANKLRLLDNKLNESEWDLDLLLEDISTRKCWQS